MGKWEKTGCVLCGQNCGLEVYVDNNRIEKVRGDKDNPRSIGYICRKGMNIAYHQHHDQRLKHPLKKVDNSFVRIPWNEAINVNRLTKNTRRDHFLATPLHRHVPCRVEKLEA